MRNRIGDKFGFMQLVEGSECYQLAKEGEMKAIIVLRELER